MNANVFLVRDEYFQISNEFFSNFRSFFSLRGEIYDNRNWIEWFGMGELVIDSLALQIERGEHFLC